MNLIWWAFTILLVLGLAILAIIVFIGAVALFVVSIVEYIEKKLQIAQAEKLKEERKREFKGPWTLTPKVRPYSSKVFHFFKAKEIVEKK